MPGSRVFGTVNFERPDFECESSTVVSFVAFDSRFVVAKPQDGRLVFNATFQARAPSRRDAHHGGM